jgi:hypothetical protein
MDQIVAGVTVDGDANVNVDLSSTSQRATDQAVNTRNKIAILSSIGSRTCSVSFTTHDRDVEYQQHVHPGYK